MGKERIASIFLAGFLAVSMITGCSSQPEDTVHDSLAGMEQEGNVQIQQIPQEAEVEDMQAEQDANASYTADTFISDVTGDPVFGDYGRLIFPADASADGEVDFGKFTLITYDPIHHGYYALGEKVGNAFKDGAALK